ncbi:MAG: 4Fe-4S dicluster domain-containing protein [Coriobacteriales bacterium]|nr:4Fe-4S dicluster domain-containing protein [Coriobacteriales bacterium]
MYPVKPPTYTSRSKGLVENNIDTCIFCKICEKRCPTYAIQVDKEDRTWSIDIFSCIQCQNCIRQCPKNCLNMNPQHPGPSAEKVIKVVIGPDKPAEDGDKPNKAANQDAANAEAGEL